jgi:glycosyltransferase involved in cell wall biosynthesis
MKNMKVALISHEFPPFAFGGIGYQCYDLAYSLSRKKIDTVVLCGKSPHKRIEKPNDFLTIIRLPYIDVPPRYVWFQLQNARVLQKLVEDCSVIHGVNPMSSAIAAYYKIRLGKPFVVTCHHSMLLELKEFLNLPTSEWTLGNFSITVLSYPLDEIILMNICLKSADRIIVPGLSTVNYIKNTVGNLDLKKTTIIHNGIDFTKIDKIITRFGEDYKEDDSLDGETTIAFYGRLVSTKGIMYLLEAMAILSAEFPRLRLSIFGQGPLESKIRLKVNSLGLQNKVKLHGYVSYTQLISQICKASVVALPSLVEVGPFIAALEAMACKKPLVLFDSAFSREFISNMHNGLLAKACDSRDLSDKIRILLIDEKLRRRIGQNAYTYVKKNHDWDILVDKYIETYKEAAQ